MGDQLRYLHDAAIGSACPDDGRGSLRVLIGTDTYHPDANGTSAFTYHLAVGLSSRGHEVHVIAPAHPGYPAPDCGDGVCAHGVPSLPAAVYPTFRVCLPSVARRHAVQVAEAVHPDVVHVQGHLPIGRALARWAHARGVPLVATNHFMADNMFAYVRVPGRSRRALCRAVWRDLIGVFEQADVITTPTEVAARLMRDMGLARDVEAVSGGVDLSRFHPRPVRERPAVLADVPRRPSVLFVGRLELEKHVDELIDALAIVRGSLDAQLLIAGHGGQRRALEERARQRSVSDAVRFLGVVPDEELPVLYAAGDVFAMPSRAELQSLATLEAMASGKPVVAADAMALPTLVRSGDNGFLYPPGDVDALAGRLLDLFQSPDLRERMGRASRELAVTHDIGHTLERFETLYLRAAGVERAARAAGAPHGAARQTGEEERPAA